MDDPSAVRWCFIGALKREADFIGWPLPGPAHEAFERVIAAAGWPKGICHNDPAAPTPHPGENRG